MNSSPHSRRSYKEKCGVKGPQTASILRMYDTENISLPQPDQQVLTSNPLPQSISSRFLIFHNRDFTRTERFHHRLQTAGCGPQSSQGRMPFLNHRRCLQRIRRAYHTKSERVHTLFSRANSIRDCGVGGYFNQNRFCQSSYRTSTT